MRLLLFTVLTTSLFLSQSPGFQRSSQCRWSGSLSATRVGTYGETTLTETLIGNAVFEYDTTNVEDVQYKLIGGHFTYSAHGSAPDCVMSGDYAFDLTPDSLDNGSIIIYTNGGYSGYVGCGHLATTPVLATTCSGTTYYSFPSLTGTSFFSTDSTVVEDVMTGTYDTLAVYEHITLGWSLSLSGVDTRLIVEPDAYDTWLPRAGKSEDTPGPPIAVFAHLEEGDGSTGCAIADSFTFQLIEVSHEKGVACNYPESADAKESPDFHFAAEFISENDVISADKLTLKTDKGREATAYIPCYDWGAYAKLKVTAYKHDGSTIVGYLKDHPATTEIPIPKRTGNSKIADKWKQDRNVVSLSDDDDGESKPEGDGNPGDGFTLYEEYRGFYENSRHIYGDPLKKDLFIYASSAIFYPGIRLFRNITQLNVHYKLFSDEFDTAVRSMNFNHTDAPHDHDQHGLWIEIGDGDASRATSLGPPRKVDTVLITRELRLWRTFRTGGRRVVLDELGSTVAHELCHAVCVSHHGQVDPRKSTYLTEYGLDLAHGEDVTYKENGSTVFVLWENNTPYTGDLTGDHYVAAWAGEHSGMEDCVMRYDVAYLYIPGMKGTSPDRYLVLGNERTGMKLCDKQNDDPGGVNYLSRQPRPRYGPATDGACKNQICVNDKYH